jgi:hypothetical protein
MPEDNYGNEYTYECSGENNEVNLDLTGHERQDLTLCQGNHYCSRDFGPDAPNDNSYHYSNQ